MLRHLVTVGLFVAVAACAQKEAKVDTTATVAAAPNVVTFTAKDKKAAEEK